VVKGEGDPKKIVDQSGQYKIAANKGMVDKVLRTRGALKVNEIKEYDTTSGDLSRWTGGCESSTKRTEH